MKFKSFGPVNANKTDSKVRSTNASPKYVPAVLPKLRNGNATV